MKSEINVIHLLKSSAIARQFIEQEYGKNAKKLLENLPLKETLNDLAKCLAVVPERVFETLAEQLKSEIQGKKAPSFLNDQLATVIKSDIQLGSLLGCDVKKALENLFDVQIIWNSIFAEEPATGRQKLKTSIQNNYLLPTAENVLYEFLALYQKTHYKISIGKILDKNHFLQRSALTKLRNNALKKGYTIGSDSSLLRVAIDSDCNKKKIHEKNLDTLAIISIQQRIKWIVLQLQDQAQKLASNISDSVPENTFLGELQPHIEFYELKFPASAWRGIFSRIKLTNPQNQDRLQENTSKSTQLHKTLLLEAWEQIPELLPCLILTGISMPKTTLTSIWSKQLSNQDPFPSIKSDKDILYPINRKNIIEKIKGDYVKHGRTYKYFN